MLVFKMTIFHLVKTFKTCMLNSGELKCIYMLKGQHYFSVYRGIWHNTC